MLCAKTLKSKRGSLVCTSYLPEPSTPDLVKFSWRRVQSGSSNLLLSVSSGMMRGVPAAERLRRAWRHSEGNVKIGKLLRSGRFEDAWDVCDDVFSLTPFQSSFQASTVFHGHRTRGEGLLDLEPGPMLLSRRLGKSPVNAPASWHRLLHRELTLSTASSQRSSLS